MIRLFCWSELRSRMITAIALLATHLLCVNRSHADHDVDGQSTSRPNILWIIAEDMSPDLGYMKTPQVATPRIDALAAGGMRFDNLFTTAPVS